MVGGIGGAGGADGQGVTFMHVNEGGIGGPGGGTGGAGGFGGIGGEGSFSLPALPTQMLDLSMSPKSQAASGGFVANISHQGDWLFDIGARSCSDASGFSRNEMQDWEALRRRERELEMNRLASTRPGFSRLNDEPVDVSHVKPKVDCGRHARKKKPRKKKKRIKIPTFESQLELVNQGDSDLFPKRKVQSMRLPSRLPPIETRQTLSSPRDSPDSPRRARQAQHAM